MELMFSGRSLINIMKRMCHNTEPWKLAGVGDVGGGGIHQTTRGGGGCRF